VSRDFVVATMMVVLAGGVAWLAGWIPVRRSASPPDVSAREIERKTWRRLWWPLVPSALALATMLGWRLQEPSVTDEPLRPIAALIVLPLALLWARAIARACRALRVPPKMPPIATVGLLRPRIVVSQKLDETLDAESFAAALAHERAHVRRRDPLRIWLAQLATDLQGPFAKRRFDAWADALEIARDEEARVEGVPGEDLAAAIVAVAKMAAPTGRAMATLTGTEASLTVRVRRLLEPLPAHHWRRSALLPVALVTALALGVGIGLRCGDAVLRVLPFIGA
jgi:hypothetical protein